MNIVKIYIASSWKNQSSVLKLATRLEDNGFEVDAFCRASATRYAFHWSKLVDNEDDLRYYDAIEMGLLKGPDDFFEKFKNSDLISVNFTDLPTEECHRLLFAANTELITDHFLKTKGDMREAKNMIDAFYGLYFEKEYKFRGARHYERKIEGKESPGCE